MDLALTKLEIHLMHFWKLFLFQDVDVFKGKKTGLIQSIIQRFQTFRGILKASDFKEMQRSTTKINRAMKACPSQVPERALYNTSLADKSKWPEFHQYC